MPVFAFNIFLIPLGILVVLFGIGLAVYQRFAGERLRAEGRSLSSAGDISRWGLLFILELGSIIAGLTTLFAWIDKAVADVLITDRYNVTDVESVRYAISVLFVVAPIAIALAWFSSRIDFKKPELFETLARKSNLWAGLVASSALVVVTLIATISNFLSGEITPRFLAKAGVLVLIGAVIAALRVWRLRAPLNRLGAHTVSGIGATALIVGIVLGFLVIGSPMNARLQKLDDIRVQHLWNIEQRIVDHYQKNRVLPPSLGDLDDRGPLPVDPTTGKAYVYDVAMVKQAAPGGMSAFHLCANFEAASREVKTHIDGGISQPLVLQGPWEGSVAWQHPAGEYCFERQINPKDFPQANMMPIEAPGKFID
jgi:hypothetical protein